MILYFTGTGNSRYVANKLASYLQDQIESINTYFKEKKKGVFHSEKPYIIVVPSYMSRMPMKVEEFLLNASFNGNKNAYFVFTAGSAIGNAGKYCEQICKKHNLCYRGIQNVEMSPNYIVMYDVLDRSKAKEQAKQAIPAIEYVANRILRNKDLLNEGYNGHKSFSVIAPTFTKFMVSSKAFYCEDSCIQCGKCISLCPLNNISMKEGKITWQNNCMHCMACISACPTRAIQYGKGTKNKNRYYLEEE